MSAGADARNIAALIENLQDPNRMVRIRATTVLGSMGERALAAVPALIELLQAERAYERQSTALTLGKIGPAAEQSLPALCAAADDEDQGVSAMAEWAMKEIDVEAP
jgi:HEAT repeat protein